MRKKTTEEFVLQLVQRNPDVLVIGEYTGSKNKIEVQCKKCGNEWASTPTNLLSGYGCPRCYGTPKKTNKEFVAELRKKYPEAEVLDEYVNAKTAIKIRCKQCGEVWLAKPNNLLKGTRCPKCYGTSKKSSSEFLSQVNKINKSIELVEDYKNARTKIKVRCKKCGHEWKCRPNDLIREDGRNTGCPQCAGNRKKSHEIFLKEVATTSPKVEVLGEYSGRRKTVLVQCRECGYQWFAKAEALLKGRMCPQCFAGHQTSYFEQCIYLALINIMGEKKIIHRDKTAIGKELDIYIPHLKIAIEPGGWFWHKDKLDVDKEKQQLCKEKGIKLLTVYDDVGTEIEKTDYIGLWMFIPEDIGVDRNNIELLGRVLNQVFKSVGIDYNPNHAELEELRRKAEYAVRKKTTTDFSNELAEVNPSIIVIGDYLGTHTKIHVKCKKCGHEWYGDPSNLLRKHGCPKCGGALKKTHDEYIVQLEQINPNLEVLGEYKGARKKIKVRCSICEYEWETIAGSLLAGHGCPKARFHNKK